MKKLKQLYPSFFLVILLGACSTENSQPAAELDPDKPETILFSETARTHLLQIVFLGDSITAGFGLGSEQAFPALIQTELDQNGYAARVINAGISGDTSTGGLNRINWLLQNRIDILVLELGGNDGLRGIDLSLTRSNLSEIIRITHSAWPDVKVIVAGMMIPPNLGHAYTEQFRGIFPDIAQEHGAALIPFILEGVGGIRELNQPDGIHPTAEGHRIVAETLWKTLEPIVKELS